MVWKTIRDKYHLLGAEERFRLLLAAEGRDDQSETNALKKSADKPLDEVDAHVRYLEAFEGIALALFMELVEDAAFFNDRWDFYSEQDEIDEIIRESKAKRNVELDNEGEGEDDEAEDTTTEADEEVGDDGYTDMERAEVLVKASGYLFVAKYRGWAAFCEKLGIPPHHPWQSYPGCKRLIQNIEIGERWAFTEEEMLGWLQSQGSENTQVGMRAEQVTKTLINALKKATKHCPK